ncbi:MAG: hypothetical protein HY744_15635 [Deltaproteobacteria bacterium]|nr:hypothetical protein [Deltaproteobacteria bacterium]
MTSVTEKTYEMMWDCEYCGKKKLLGKTHRHCPNCGAPQNPDKRYFPPENEKVAVEDHEYVGRDVLCPACQVASSRAAQCCGNCGSPLTGGKDARVQQEQVVGPGGAPAQPGQPGAAPAQYGGAPYPAGYPAAGPAAPGAQAAAGAKAPAGSKAKVGILAAIVALLVFCGVGFVCVNYLWTEEGTLSVTGHTWKRAVAVERYDDVRDKSPCSSMPSGARNVQRTKGEPVCTTRKIDQGDGTFKERRECKDAVEQCEYTVLKWAVARSETATGNSVDDQPRWPEVRLGPTGNCVGCEREGSRTETYTVLLVNTKSKKEDRCELSDQTKWASFKKGASYKGQVSVMLGGVRCDSLKAK